jgi:hypothetical protein
MRMMECEIHLYLNTALLVVQGKAEAKPAALQTLAPNSNGPSTFAPVFRVRTACLRFLAAKGTPSPDQSLSRSHRLSP